MPQLDDRTAIAETRNIARFFTENRAISWVLLVAVFLWGYYGYQDMPKRKDPDIPLNLASVVTPWPGKTAEEVEQLVTYPIEQVIVENSRIRPLSDREWGLKSISLPGVSIIQVRLSQDVTKEDKLKQFNDIYLKLQNFNDSLPPSAGPIQLDSGFSDTASLMLEVASPKENAVALSLRARDISEAIRQVRKSSVKEPDMARVSIIYSFPRKSDPEVIIGSLDIFLEDLQKRRPDWDIYPVSGASFAGVDLPAVASMNDDDLLALTRQFMIRHFGLHQFHPDLWAPVVIRDPDDTLVQVKKAPGDKYSYRQMDDFTDLVARNLLLVSEVAKVNRSGVLPEQVYLGYSQTQLAAYGLQPEQIKNALDARNVAYSGGNVQIQDVSINISPSGQFKSADEIGNVVVARDSSGLPVYLRSIAEIHRGYQYPPRFLNYFSWRDQHSGKWQQGNAVAVAAFMRDGDQLRDFASGITTALDRVKSLLPDDLVIERVSDQAQQAADSTALFVTALYEAIIMVVIVALLGFREWRSALVMLIAIPLTMTMTFGMIDLLGIDIQQVSIVGLIIALGLLVDDPVVACDAIKRNMDQGHPPIIAAWLGPTRLASAIMYATVTNIAAYLPLLLITGDLGQFLYSLPVVMACSLVASRIVSMTFIPLLGFYLIRRNPNNEPSLADRRSKGFSGYYYRIGACAIEHRKKVLAASMLILLAGVVLKSHLVSSFFPYDVQHLSYIDVWLRNNASLQQTGETADQAVRIIQQVAAEYARELSGSSEQLKPLLESVSINLGGSGPKFWFSVISQVKQMNYAQLVVRVSDKDASPELIRRWQQALSAQVPGAMINVNQLQTQPVTYPVGIRISSRAALDGSMMPDDIKTLRKLAETLKTMLREIPLAERVSDDWGAADFTVNLAIDPDRANLAGVTNADVAYSSALATSGLEMTEMRIGDKQIPVVTELKLNEKAKLSDLDNLYVYSSDSEVKVPITEVADIEYGMETGKIVRMRQFRSITVYAYPVPGAYPSEIMNRLRDGLEKFAASLPPGYQMDITGSEASAKNGNGQLKKVLLICIGLIYLALVIQFRDAVKPLLVFAAVPYGVCGAFAGLFLMGSSFGFMAFLGIVALVGVIVSHIIVLFDFVEKARESGESLCESLLDAGIYRLRPVLITVGATIMALLPLSIHGGPLWQPLCYAQIGGLAMATVITLLLVPVFYSIFVLDLKIVKWQDTGQT